MKKPDRFPPPQALLNIYLSFLPISGVSFILLIPICSMHVCDSYFLDTGAHMFSSCKANTVMWASC